MPTVERFQLHFVTVKLFCWRVFTILTIFDLHSIK